MGFNGIERYFSFTGFYGRERDAGVKVCRGPAHLYPGPEKVTEQGKST